ncbi:MAG: hypothetical protein JWR22_764 [Herminiimonas sp.]|nr:hypothetical protein [Herminiimonas sp.]
MTEPGFHAFTQIAAVSRLTQRRLRAVGIAPVTSTPDGERTLECPFCEEALRMD